GAHDFERGAFGNGNIRVDTNGFDGHTLLRFFVKAERTSAAGQSREKFDSFHDTPKERHVAVELARRMARDDVEFRASAAVRGRIATGAEHSVAMDQPHLSTFWIARHREAARKTDFRRVDIAVGQPREWELRIEWAIEFG